MVVIDTKYSFIAKVKRKKKFLLYIERVKTPMMITTEVLFELFIKAGVQFHSIFSS